MTAKTCSVDGCTKLVHCKAMCDQHYRASMPPKLCTVDGCDSKVRARGLCRSHLRGDRAQSLQARPQKPCSVDGCDKNAHSAGKCWRHYMDNREGVLPACTVDGCTKPQRCRKMCMTHYHRLMAGRDLGDPHPQSERVIEDVEWIAGTDDPDSIATRCGFSGRKSLYDALRRWDRQDLVDLCQQWWLTHGDQRAAA